MDTQMSELIKQNDQNKERIIKLETKIEMGFCQMGKDIQSLSDTLDGLPDKLNQIYVRKDFYDTKHQELIDFRDDAKRYFFWFTTTIGAILISAFLFLIIELR
jgi:hypothetical protein